MAQLKAQPNNRLSGKLGELVYYERNGKTFVRTLPSKNKGRITEKQSLNQKRFAELGRLYRTFRHALRYQLPKGVYSKNTFFYSLNSSFINTSLSGVSIDYEKLILSNLGIKELFGLEITSTERQITFQWKPDNFQDNSYYVLCAVYSKGLQQLHVTDTKRNALSATINLPIGAGDIVTYTITHRRDK